MRNPFLQPVCAPTARRLSVVCHFDPARRQNQHPKIPVAERRIGKTAPCRLKSTRDCSGFLLLPAQTLRQTGCRKGQIFSLHAPGIPGKEKKTVPLTFPPVRLRYRDYAWGTGDRRPAHWPRTCGCGFPRAASPGSPHFAFLSFCPLSASSSSMMAPAMSADSAPPAAAIFCLRRSISSLTVPSGYRSRRSPSAFSQPSSS